MNDEIGKAQPFDTFSTVFKILGWAGYFKPLNNPSGYKRVLHQIYRPLVFLMIVIYNLQHLIFTVQTRHDYEKLMDNLIIEIPHFNLMMKVATLIYQTSRIDRLNSFLKEDITFRASDEEGQSILQKNKEEMQRFRQVTIICVSVTAFFWPSSYIARRYYDPEQIVPSYMPFETDTWVKYLPYSVFYFYDLFDEARVKTPHRVQFPRFLLSVFLEIGPILWIGYGHIYLDILVSTYYAHAQTQLKVIKQRLEHFVTKEETRTYMKSSFQYRDLIDDNVGKQFVLIVRRYEKLIWYKNEVDAIFNFSLSFQFLSSSATICLVIYCITVISLTIFSFFFLVFLLVLLLTEVFFFCYFGNLLEFESRSINNSVYNCDWLSLSPPFRRQMLIAMTRWSKPIQAKVCYIIPLSLTSFITIVKSSYTLYTVLVNAKTKNA